MPDSDLSFCSAIVQLMALLDIFILWSSFPRNLFQLPDPLDERWNEPKIHHEKWFYTAVVSTGLLKILALTEVWQGIRVETVSHNSTICLFFSKSAWLSICKIIYHSMGKAPLPWAKRIGKVARNNVTRGTDGAAVLCLLCECERIYFL